MKGKTCIIATVALVAVSVPSVASATNGKGHWHHPKVKKTVHVAKVKKSTQPAPKPWPTPEQIGQAISVYVPEADDPERAGYCAPMVIPRPYEAPGIFYNGYADDESRAFYHSLGFTDALVDPVSGAISC